VLVAASLEPARRALDVLWPLLLIALPIILAAVGLVIWALTGRALRPVEAMREQAAVISAAELERRLPVPPSHDEVHRLAMTLNDMLDRLEAAALRQQRFVADASHELKSPVAAMRTMLEVAERDPHFEDWRTLLADLGREDRRLERLIGDLLTLARFDEHALAVRRAEVDLDQIVGREAEAAGRDGGRVDASEVRPMRILGDPDALARLFRNLVDNAARFAAATVWVESEAADGEAVVWISDDGPGIPASAREHVFERFVRLDESRDRRAGGSGLGLALARAVAVAHGGKIAVIEPRHGGATIEVRLPAGLGDPAG
jgi:signal transduction histidine kinase